MEGFSNRELADIHFVYGFCNGRAMGAVQEYRRRFPNRRVPDRRVFINSHRNLVNHGSFNRVRGQGRPQGNYNLEHALNLFQDDPTRSIRTVSRLSQIPRAIVSNIISLLLYYYFSTASLTLRHF